MLYGLATAVIITGVLLGVGAMMAADFQQAAGTSTTYTDTVAAFANGTSVEATFDDWISGATFTAKNSTSTTLTVGTGSEDIYVESYSEGKWHLQNNSYAGQAGNITYTTYERDVAYNATDDGIVAIGDLGSWIGILVLVVIAGVIIGFLLKTFVFTGRNNASV